MIKMPQLFGLPRSRSTTKTVAAEWKEIEYFDPVWEDRVSMLYKLIKGTGRLVDFGCGRQYVRKYLPSSIQYIPVDYVSRSPDTIVADFNGVPYPEIDGDIAFISGFLEYMEDPGRFLRQIINLSYGEIVMSYCTLETVGSVHERLGLGWKNHLPLRDLLKEILPAFSLQEMAFITKNTILRFERKK